MSIRAIQAVWDHSQHKAAKRLLMLALADSAQSADFRVWLGHDSLAIKCNVTDRYIRKMLAEIAVSAKEARALQENGQPLPELVYVAGGNGPHDTTTYFINLPGAELGPFDISPSGGIIFSLERGNPSSSKRGNPSSARGNPSSARGNPSSARGNPSSAKGEPQIPQSVRAVSDPLGTVSDPGRSPALFVEPTKSAGDEVTASPPHNPPAPSDADPRACRAHGAIDCFACLVDAKRPRRAPTDGWKRR